LELGVGGEQALERRSSRPAPQGPSFAVSVSLTLSRTLLSPSSFNYPLSFNCVTVFLVHLLQVPRNVCGKGVIRILQGQLWREDSMNAKELPLVPDFKEIPDDRDEEKSDNEDEIAEEEVRVDVPLLEICSA
jgi:hypothetical protein